MASENIIDLLKKVKEERNIKVFMEIPTYPYDDVFRMLTVSSIYRWHGYDRVNITNGSAIKNQEYYEQVNLDKNSAKMRQYAQERIIWEIILKDRIDSINS